MKVRHLLFFPLKKLIRASVNAVSLFHPYLTHSLPLSSISHTMHACAVSSPPLYFLPPWLSFSILCPCPCLYVPSLSPPTHSSHLLLVFMGKIWEEKNGRSTLALV